ncbi:MAG: putative response regulatory domain-containing protein [Marine Group I thaumarchaeote]|nr:MAG: putative response regulatory domain-containing protein [Marine Group I thaumarchaeote]
MKILVVDDNLSIRSMISKFFKMEGDSYEVETAENGLIALEKYAQFKPDVVILDIAMPVMDGIETLTKLRKINSDAAVIVASASGATDRVSECLKKGARGYIEKPFSPEELLATIKNLTKPDMDYDQIVSLFSRIASKMQGSLRKMVDDSVSLTLRGVDVAKLERIIDITPESVGVTTKVEGQRWGKIVAVMKKQQLRTILLVESHASELKDENASFLEFFHIINNNLLTEFANYTQQKLKILPPQFFDKENDRKVTTREFIQILFDIKWKEEEIPLKIYQCLT